MVKQKVWFITGVSRGLGRSLARAALESNALVIGTSRSGDSDLPVHPNFSIMALDVTNEEQIIQVIKAAHGLHGRLDVVVNNAGYSVLGAVEEISASEARAQFDTCFFGPLAIMQAALPILRHQKSGHIINVSSVAGCAPVASAAVYAASKFALEGVSEGLAQEVQAFGIHVTIVEPGAFRTDFLTDRSMQLAAPLEAYAQTVGPSVSKFKEMNGGQRGDPDKAAQLIVELTTLETPPLHFVLGADAYDRVERKLTLRLSELHRMETTTKSTDYK